MNFVDIYGHLYALTLKLINEEYKNYHNLMNNYILVGVD